jgi:hypothetical protein
MTTYNGWLEKLRYVWHKIALVWCKRFTRGTFKIHFYSITQLLKWILTGIAMFRIM